MTSDEIFKRSVCEVNKHIIRISDEDFSNTLFDRRMGPIKDLEKCLTCSGSLYDCPGHFGHINLAVPIIFDFYVSYVKKVMEESCQSCSRELIGKTRGATCPFCYYPLPRISIKNQDFYLRTKDKEVIWTAVEVLAHFKKLKRGVELVFERLVVIPTVKRPWRNFKGTEWVVNDLSLFYSQIIRCNNELLYHMESPDTIKSQKIHLLKKACAVLFDSTRGSKDERYSRKQSNRKGLKQQIENKHGVMRSNLMGFRVEHTARTVISANPWLRVDEVGVPIHFATILTVEEVIKDRPSLLNFREMITNNIITTVRIQKEQVEITKSNKAWNLIQLSVGDSVFRPLRNGDVILMNRQPTLHMASFMAFVVRLIPFLVFQFNLSVCPPFNADFDGDEMNAHVLKNIKARVEASKLMWVGVNIISPQSSKPLISLIYDSLFGMHEMSKPGVFVRESLWMDIVVFQERTLIGCHRIDPTIGPLQQREEYRYARGCDLLSLAFPINFNFKMDDVVIRDGWLVSGVLTKKILSCHNGIVQCLCCDYSQQECIDFLSNIQFIITPWLQSRGTSLSVMDGYVPHVKPTLKSLENLSEVEVMTYLNEVRDSFEVPNVKNGMMEIISAGSKGSNINFTQTAFILGQQTLNGGRVPKQLNNGKRRLPHFKMDESTPDAGGFVSSCFYEGLSPTECFAHIQSGREGVIDMGIKTGKSGYLARQLIKTQETVQIAEDYTVRSCSKIIQFKYGGDGFKVTSFRRCGAHLFPLNFDFLYEKYSHCVDLCENPELIYPEIREGAMFEYYMSFPTHPVDFCFAVRAELEFARAEPGLNVGVIAATSVSEPATQLALNTFHFAGMAGFTTLGFPRIRELSNVTESTPTVTVGYAPFPLAKEVLLKDLIHTCYIFSPKHRPQEEWEVCFLEAFHLNEKPFVAGEFFIELVFYELVTDELLEAIQGSHIKKRVVRLFWFHNKVRIYFLNKRDTFVDIQRQLKAIQHAHVRGIPGVLNVVGSELLVDPKRFSLKNLFRVGCKNITSNSTMLIYKNFGIIATRNNLVREFEKVICSKSFVNERHYSLLSDLMCYSGEPDTIQRFGNVHVSNESPIAKATYEQPIKAFTDGAVNKQVDLCTNISTRIAIGVPISGIIEAEEEDVVVRQLSDLSEWATSIVQQQYTPPGSPINFSRPASPEYRPSSPAATPVPAFKHNFISMQLPDMFP